MYSRRGIWPFLIGIILVISVGLVGHKWLSRQFLSLVKAISLPYEFKRVAATLPSELAAAKKEGLPLSAAEVRAKPPIPASQNAAPLYRKLDKLMRAKPLNPEENDAVSNVATGESSKADQQTAQATLQRHSEWISLAEKAAALSYCDFQRPWQDGAAVMSPEFADAREIARLFAARAALQDKAGHSEDALRSTAVGARIGQQIGKDPIIIAVLVQIAIEQIMDKRFQAIVKSQADNPEILRLAKKTNQAFGGIPDLSETLRGEMVMGRADLERLRHGTPPGTVDPSLKVSFKTPTEQNMFYDACDARLLNYWRRAFALLRQTKGDLMAQYRVMQKFQTDEEAKWRDDPTYLINAIVCPVSLELIPIKHVDAQAQSRLRLTLITLLEFRRKNGNFPEKISELSPSAPSDPFTDQPLIYRKTEKGLLLYSVGENLKDDGGKSRSEARRNKSDAWDIVVSYP